MWYTDEDEEAANKGIEGDDEEEEDDEDDIDFGTENEDGAQHLIGSGDHLHHPQGDLQAGLHQLAQLECFMRSIDHGLSLLVHWSTKHWKLDGGDKAMDDNEFDDSVEQKTQVFPLLKNVKKHLKRIKKDLKKVARSVDDNNEDMFTASLEQLKGNILAARAQLLEKYSYEKVHVRLKKEGKDYESKRKDLESNRSYKRALRLILRFLRWWWKATLFCAMLFLAGAGLLYWGSKTRFRGLIKRYYRAVSSIRRYMTSSIWARSYMNGEGRSDGQQPAVIGTLGDIIAEGGLAVGKRGMGIADRVFSIIKPRTIIVLFLRCLLLGLAFAFYQVIRRVKQEKQEVIKFMRDVEQKLKAERDREALKDRAESRREEKEELQKFPDEFFMKVANRMWEVMQESVEKLITACNEQGADRVLGELTGTLPAGMGFVHNGITYSHNVDARTNFDAYFANCKNHVRGVISSYENLLETIDFRKRQAKLTKQFARFEKLNAAMESGEHATRKKQYLDGEDEEEDGYGINNKDALGDDDDEVDDGFSLFGFGGGKQAKADDRGKGKKGREEDDYASYENESDDSYDEEKRSGRRRSRGRSGSYQRYGPSGEVLDDYWSDDDAGDREFADDEEGDDGGDDTAYDGGSNYANFEEMADIHSNYEHMD